MPSTTKCRVIPLSRVSCASRPMMFQKSRPAVIVVENDCHCCAERRMIRNLLRVSVKKGVAFNNFSRWVHRVHGDLVVWRPRKDGIMGTSIPCVLCRKMIEKYNIQWTAYNGTEWVHSNRGDVPASRPTHKQIRYLDFSSNNTQ